MSKFINPANVVAQTGLLPGQSVADFGCGSGFYSIPAAHMVGNEGTVYAIDILEDKLAVTQSTAQQLGCRNITVVKADLEKPLSNTTVAACDAVIISNILHEVDKREPLLKNAYQLLKTGGRLLVVEWKKEVTPLGPPQEVRVSEGELDKLMMTMGFKKSNTIDADSFHYAALYIK